MAVSATLGQRTLQVEPGGSATFEVTIRNDGPAVESLRLRVGGAAGPFSYCVPDSLTLEPGSATVARIGFRMPRTSLPPAGPLGFTVAVVQGSDGPKATGEILTEGTVEVAPFSALSLTLDPPEASGKGPSEHRLAVGTRGNAPVNVALSAEDADGVDLRIEPARLDVSPESAGGATVRVVPRKRRFTGPDQDRPFTVLATPSFGEPARIGGKLVQRAAVATGTLVRSAVLAGVVVIALVVGLAVFPDGSGTPSTVAAPDTAGALADCPAAGRIDRRGVSGLRPEDIPSLPNGYSFFQVKSDGCTPIRFNPCEPIAFVQNVALAPPTGPDDVREAFRRLSAATGMTFVDEGTTDETSRRNPYVPDRYPGRWAPILVNWTRFGDQGPDPTIQAVGRGIGARVEDVLVSGQLSLNVDAVTDREARTPVEGGFGPPVGSGTGAIGPKGVTWGRIILHELAHVVGLGHVRDKGSIMYPETAEQTFRPSEYRSGDLEGLRYLGREAGCLTTPTPGPR